MAEEPRKYVAEFIGTFMLVFFAAGAVVVSERLGGVPGPVMAGIASGLALMTIIWMFGHVSGAHVNPALSVCAAGLGLLSWRLVPGYIVAQLAGSGLAGYTLLWTIGNYGQMGANLPNLALGMTPATALAIEIILSFIMMVVILMVIDIKGHLKDFAAVPIGAIVGIEVMLLGPIAGAAMNPARAFGPYLALGDWTHFWIYVVGPFVGLAVATGLVRVAFMSQRGDRLIWRRSTGEPPADRSLP